MVAERSLPAANEADKDGNARFYGFECENLGDGEDPWLAVQLDAIERMSAALCRAHKWGAARVIGHPARPDSEGAEVSQKTAFDANQRTIRTVFQAFLGLAAGLPLIIDASRDPADDGGFRVALAVAGAVTRVMALPVVHNLLPNWLYRSDPPAGTVQDGGS